MSDRDVPPADAAPEPPRDGDAERLERLKSYHLALDVECNICFLVSQIDSRDAALREAEAKIERYRSALEAARVDHIRAQDHYAAAKEGITRATEYLRGVFQAAAPQCEPFGKLLNLCTQIDNLIAGQKGEIARLTARNAALEAAVRAGRECRDVSLRRKGEVSPALAMAQLDEALARLDAAPAGDDGWRSIETAPKDGTKILIARAGEDISADPIEITEWFKTDHVHFEPVPGEVNLYYRRVTTYYEGWNGNGHRATHWRPLPAPPPAPREGETP